MALPFRQRIFVWLVVIAAVPATIAIGVSLLSPQFAAPVGGVGAWERAATSLLEARRALEPGAAGAPSPPAARAALERHSSEIGTSLRRARQAQAIRTAFSGTLAAVAVALAALVAGGAVRLAGHLSRQLSRPIEELVAWTGHLARGEPLPDTPPARGAPEFAALREAFRTMAAELGSARAREVEAAELRAFREMARQVAHELKNPLTPMRFAVARLAEDASAEERELLEIIDGESARIERMARDFSDLGRLPEGPPAPVDIAELLAELVRGGVPNGVTVRIRSADGLPRVSGHYEPLRRAFQNLLLNAYDACLEAGARAGQEQKAEAGTPRAAGTGLGAAREGRAEASGRARAAAGEVVLTARPATDAGGDSRGAAPAVEITVSDNGVGIRPEHLGRLFEPYFTTKPQGTGLGLALVRQTVHDHRGTVGVTSETGRGTTFTVTLPVAGA
ncbi:MAG: HAMP domain-containing histidine kinase [Gemmatimonadetes bacterium]|nr:HAMP domain-containing histidine kinase [Gemmatimonadota bacterium]